MSCVFSESLLETNNRFVLCWGAGKVVCLAFWCLKVLNERFCACLKEWIVNMCGVSGRYKQKWLETKDLTGAGVRGLDRKHLGSGWIIWRSGAEMTESFKVSNQLHVLYLKPSWLLLPLLHKGRVQFVSGMQDVMIQTKPHKPAYVIWSSADFDWWRLVLLSQTNNLRGNETDVVKFSADVPETCVWDNGKDMRLKWAKI